MKSHRDEVLRVVSSLRFKSKVRKLAGWGPWRSAFLQLTLLLGRVGKCSGERSGKSSGARSGKWKGDELGEWSGELRGLERGNWKVDWNGEWSVFVVCSAYRVWHV